jgi:hypothetical protein
MRTSETRLNTDHLPIIRSEYRFSLRTSRQILDQDHRIFNQLQPIKSTLRLPNIIKYLKNSGICSQKITYLIAKSSISEWTDQRRRCGKFSQIDRFTISVTN